MNPSMDSAIGARTAGRRLDCDEDWLDLAAQWSVRPGTTYLNHGSFGIPPAAVRDVRRRWVDAVDEQPMDVFVRQFEPALRAARRRLAEFLGTAEANLVFTENATGGMNILAHSWPLRSRERIVLNPHEYGAVRRIWERAAARAGASVVDLQLPAAFESHQQWTDAVASQLDERCALLVISHITSPTALILPVREIIAAAHRRGVPVCVDGPHAPAHLPLDLDALECDFYVASCHKWLSATLGSGFFYAHPRWQERIQPPILSWGRLLPNVPQRWDEEFIWSGTRDPSIYLSVPAAIDFLQQVGAENFRRRTYFLAEEAGRRLGELAKGEPLGRGCDRWYGTMCHWPLPPGDWSHLQETLWRQYQIEVPIIFFDNRWFIRVSCHLYTTTGQIQRLVEALAAEFRGR